MDKRIFLFFILSTLFILTVAVKVILGRCNVWGRGGLCLSSNGAKWLVRLCMHCWICVIDFEVKSLISGENCKFKLYNSPIILTPLTVFSTNQVLYFMPYLLHAAESFLRS